MPVLYITSPPVASCDEILFVDVPLFDIAVGDEPFDAVLPPEAVLPDDVPEAVFLPDEAEEPPPLVVLFELEELLPDEAVFVFPEEDPPFPVAVHD